MLISLAAIQSAFQIISSARTTPIKGWEKGTTKLKARSSIWLLIISTHIPCISLTPSFNIMTKPPRRIQKLYCVRSISPSGMIISFVSLSGKIIRIRGARFTIKRYRRKTPTVQQPNWKSSVGSSWLLIVYRNTLSCKSMVAWKENIMTIVGT